MADNNFKLNKVAIQDIRVVETVLGNMMQCSLELKLLYPMEWFYNKTKAEILEEVLKELINGKST